MTPDGFLVIDKPAGWTSHDVVARVRRLAGTKKVGHAGTLDPMATGVLVVGIGRATRLLSYVVGADKGYDATIRLGIGTSTDDAEGDITSAVDVDLRPGHGASDAVGGGGVETMSRVKAGMARLTGAISQVPSSVSAIKVDGRRAYARVRSGEVVALAPRSVTVYSFDLVDWRTNRIAVPEGTPGVFAVHEESPGVFAVHGGTRVEDTQSPSGINAVPGQRVRVCDLSVHCEVSSGTYIRALARDLGAAIRAAGGVSDDGIAAPGHLIALRRTRVGGFTLDDACTLEQAAGQVAADGVLHAVSPAAAARAVLPVREVSTQEACDLTFGRWIEPSQPVGPVAAIGPDGALVAVLENAQRAGGRWAKPVLVLAAAG
jgi:tRNA pseudouridine55 synthase